MSMPASDVQIARYKRQVKIYRDRASGLLVAGWDRLGSYRDDDIDRYIAQLDPFLTGIKTASVGLSSAFFALTTSTRPSGITPVDVDVQPRWRDPFLSTWHAVNEGRPWDEAFQAGRSMASAVGFNFVQSTARRAGDHAARKTGKQVRWRRVPGGESCDWCLLVAGQLYQTAESADFGHDRCDCDAVPA
jgi:hypothetical protein